MDVNIGGRAIGKNYPCFIIAEAGVNHNGNIETAYKLIDAAVSAGADAIKFQTFQACKIATRYAEQARYQTENTGTKRLQHELLKELELEYEDFLKLKEYCDCKGIVFLSTPHSCNEDVDLIARICPAIKIGSGDLTNLPFLKYAACKGLPIILSTGMGTLEEVRDAVGILIKINPSVVLLHAVTSYPAPIDSVNLRAMKTLEKEFNLPVGYSDHTMSIKIPLAAVVLGACILEKHFTLDRTLPGPDHKASLEPEELKNLVTEIRATEKRIKEGSDPADIILELNVDDALGDGIKQPAKCEFETINVARKSIVANTFIKSGTVITEKMIAVKRPGSGLKPKYFWDILGKKARRDIKEDELISLGDFE